MDAHAYVSPANPRKGVDCVKCGKPVSDDVHKCVVADFSETPFLYNLLCDNARPWNKRLREELSKVVTSTQSLNAKIELTGKGPNGSGS